MAGRVLVVDDEKMIVKGLKFSLMQDYSVVDCAYDGEEALEYAKNNEYDIILLDIMLPKLDGLSVCQQIREFSDVPIIMLKAMTWTRFLALSMVQMIILQNHLTFLKLRRE